MVLPTREVQYPKLGRSGCFFLQEVSIQCWSCTNSCAITKYDHAFQRGLQRIHSKVERPGWQGQPPLIDREIIDIFMGTLIGPFFNQLIGISSVGFTELILIGERVEVVIKSGKTQRCASSSEGKQPFDGRKESDVAYSQKGRNQSNHDQHVGAILISNLVSTQQLQ